jgi:hypothetical protein
MNFSTRNPMQLNDKIIRAALVAKLNADDPGAVVLHELPLSRGERRADLAHVNGMLAGFEIKSQRDSLARMSGQAEAYAEVFERMTAVIASCHLGRLRDHIPSNWGIWVADQEAERLTFREIRKSRRNTQQKNRALVRLLWKEECAKILRELGVKTERNALVISMWRLLEQKSTKFLCEQVKIALKTRYAQRPRQQQGPYGGLRPI